MKRFQALFAITLTVASLLMAFAQFSATAQEATPQAVEADLSTFNTTLVGLLPGVSLPADADIIAARAVLAPGVVVPFASSAEAADTLFIVESGELTISVDNEALNISRQSVLNQAMASPTVGGDLFQLSTIIEPGEQGTLGAGDMMLISSTADGEMRNVTMEPVTTLMILIGPSMADEATPSP